MAADIVMPNAGFDTQAARILEWLVKPGDTVNKGDVIAVIESDKANVELESLASGTVLDLLYEANVDIPVGATIARIGSRDETSTFQPQGQKPAEAAVSAPAIEEPRISPLARRMVDDNQLDLKQISGTGPRGKITYDDVQRHLQSGSNKSEIRALPKVRKSARAAGIDLALVTPTGAAGQITLTDLEVYLARATISEPAPVVLASKRDGVTEIPLSRTRQIIGSRLQKSLQDAPHFYVTGEFDLEAALRYINTLPEPPPRVNDLIQYVTVRTLMRLPVLNATFEDGHLYQHESIHLAIAVARDDGLLTPVMKGAERYSLEGLAKESRSLIQRTRENRLQPADLGGGTFTISNLGVIPQVDQFTAVINPPQVAILAVGTVKPRPVIVNGGIHIHHTVHLTISGDHRVVDGIHLGQFLAIWQQELDQWTR